jgi:hypothetical protein
LTFLTKIKILQFKIKTIKKFTLHLIKSSKHQTPNTKQKAKQKKQNKKQNKKNKTKSKIKNKQKQTKAKQKANNLDYQ